MRAALIFSPCANPTYMPLGIATLSAFIKVNYPDCNVNILDLNIITWNLYIKKQNEYHCAHDFYKGVHGDFFDEKEYKYYGQVWEKTSEIHDINIQAARLYIEQNIIRDEFRVLLDHYSELVLTNHPELIGFSVMYPKQVLMTLALAKYLHSIITNKNYERKHHMPVIVLGGAMMSALYSDEILLSCPFVDVIFEGEGELGFLMLCQKKEFSQIPGLVHRGPESIVRNRKVDTLSLANIPLPDFSEYDIASYLNPEPVVPLIFSRGCKWRKCRFCAHNFSYSGYRRRNSVRFVEYLSNMNNQIGARHFYFADQYIDATDMKILADEIIRQDLKIFYQIMGRPLDDYTPEIFQLLYKSGCRWISWGIESGSQRVLDTCLKGTSVENIRKVVTQAHQAGIVNLMMMILGLPTATEDDFNTTFDLLDDLSESIDTINFSSFQLFDKTAFAAQAQKFGLKITGKEKIFTNEFGPAHTHRLLYKEIAADGTLRPPRGPVEVAQWQRRKLWSGQNQEFPVLSCEHYLLYAGRISRTNAIESNMPK